MSDLTFIEKTKLERLLQMDGGYVLQFSNRTLADFVAESTGRDIYDAKYQQGSGSKANRLRAFWLHEPNHVVGKLIQDLLSFCGPATVTSEYGCIVGECERIARRLQQSAPVESLDAIAAEGSDRHFEVLATAVRESIERNQPEAGLDRLHTYVTRLTRKLAEKRGIAPDRSKALPGQSHLLRAAQVLR